MAVSRDVVSLGSFFSSEEAGRIKVALMESREDRRDVLGPGLSPLGSLEMIALIGRLDM